MVDPDNVRPIRPGMDLVPRDVPPSPVTPPPGLPATYFPGVQVETLSVLDLPREGLRGWLRRRWFDLRHRRREAIQHVRNLPDYLIRAFCFSHIGAARLFRWWWAWVWNKEDLQFKRRLILDLDEPMPEKGRDGSKAQAAIAAERKHLRRSRWLRFTLTLAALAVATWAVRWLDGAAWGWADQYTAWWNHYPAAAAVCAGYTLTACAVIAILGRAGSDRGQIIPPLAVQILIQETRYDPDDIIRAALAVGFGTLPTRNRPGVFADVAPPGIRADRGGSQFRLILPPGPKAAPEFLNVAGTFAANLGADSDMIDAQPVPGRGLEVDIWLADEHRVIDPRPSPLVRSQSWCVWDPIPIGTDMRGQERYLALPWTSMFVTGLSRTGKSFFTRLPALAVALDPTADLGVWDFKPQGDWRWAKPVARWWSTDASPAGIQALADHLKWLRFEEMPRRQEVLDRIHETDPARNPEGKLTEAMTRDPDLDLGFIVDFIDELQVPLSAGKVGQQIAEHLADLVRRGPAVGIIIICTTQRLDEDSVPKTLRAVFTTKAALRTDDPGSSLLALGRPASSGWDASALPSGDDQKGFVIVVGDGAVGGAMRIRGDLANALDAAEVAARAVKARKPRPEPAAEPAGEQAKDWARVPQIVTAALAVWPETELALHQDVLADRMGWTQPDVSVGFRALGLRTEQVKAPSLEDSEVRNRRGYWRAEVVKLVNP